MTGKKEMRRDQREGAVRWGKGPHGPFVPIPTECGVVVAKSSGAVRQMTHLAKFEGHS